MIITSSIIKQSTYTIVRSVLVPISVGMVPTKLIFVKILQRKRIAS